MPRDIEDLRTMLMLNATATTHVCITDGATYVLIVPIVTSDNRHYIAVIDWPEDKIKQAINLCRERNLRIVHGQFYFLDGVAAGASMQMLLRRLQTG